MLVSVIKKDLTIKNSDFMYSYCGSPCRSFEEAAEIVYNRRKWGFDLRAEYVENGTNYIEIDQLTGEVQTEYLVRRVDK